MKLKKIQKLSTSQDRGIFLSLLVIIFFLPWLRGGEVNWQYQIFEVIIFVMFAALSLKHLKQIDFKVIRPLSDLKTPLSLLFLLCLLSFIQSIDLSIFYPLEKVTDDNLLIENKIVSLSASPKHSLDEALRQLSYLCIFILTLLLVSTKRRVKVVITLIFIVTTITAIYALINFHTQGSFFYIKTLPPWHASNYKTIHGPLSYKNHYASFLVLTIPLGLGLIVSNKLEKTKSKLSALLNLVFSKNIISLIFTLFLISILLLNTSRGGLIALFLGTCLTIAILVYTKKIKAKNLYKKIAALVFFIGILIFAGLTNKLFERIDKYGENGRDILRSTALNIAIDNPIIGTGAGTYPAIQHLYKSENLNGNKMWQHVHNDYLELLSNQGVLGLLLFCTAIILLLLKFLKGIHYNRSKLLGIQVACFCSVLCVLLHSFMDFNLQLPVINVYFYILLAVGLRISSIKHSKKEINYGA